MVYGEIQWTYREKRRKEGIEDKVQKMQGYHAVLDRIMIDYGILNSVNSITANSHSPFTLPSIKYYTSSSIEYPSPEECLLPLFILPFTCSEFMRHPWEEDSRGQKMQCYASVHDRLR